MQETRVLVEMKGTTGEETTSYWFDLPIDVALCWWSSRTYKHVPAQRIRFYVSPAFKRYAGEYVSLLTVFENLEALYICRNVITIYPDCKSMIDVAKQKLMNDPTFKHLSEDCQEYYFDFEAYASHLQEHGKFLVTEHGIFELPE